ncbi:MAG: response regulator [Ignavibacteriae bacterium]|nr:response regulator [Ignavibacteriota bacterium]
MKDNKTIILLVEDNKDFAKLLDVYLQRYEKDLFTIIWKENYTSALHEIETNPNLDVILMDYFLPGKNGLEITQELRERKVNLPIVFLTVNKDLDVALNVMKLGVAEYLIKDDISSPVLPKTLMNVIEKHKLEEQLAQQEISRERLNAMKELLANVIDDLERPLIEMQGIITELGMNMPESQQNYIKIINDTVFRISGKLEKLKQLKQDKTVKYIKDIKMIDLS